MAERHVDLAARVLLQLGLVKRGAVVDLSAESDTLVWVEIDAEILVGDDIVTTATIRVALPGPGGDSSAWHCSGSRWNP